MTENPAYIPYLEPHTFNQLGPEQVIEKMRKSGKGVRKEDWQRAFANQAPEFFRDRGDIELSREGDLELWKAVPREREAAEEVAGAFEAMKDQ